MELSARLSKEELVEAACGLLPVDIDLSQRPRRQIKIGEADLVELVAGSGLRLAGSATMLWEVAGVPMTLGVRRWQLLLVPRITRASDGLALALVPTLEGLDFRRVPGFVDDRVVDALNDVLAAQASKLVWRFERAFAYRKATTDAVRPKKELEIATDHAELTVTSEGLLLEIRLRPRVGTVTGTEQPAPLVQTSRS